MGHGTCRFNWTHNRRRGPPYVEAELLGSDVAVTWDAVGSAAEYAVLSDEGEIGRTTETRFVHEAPVPGRHLYQVEAVFDDGSRSTPSAECRRLRSLTA